MVAIKPIQATPTLKGKDAEKILKQVSIVPTKTAIEKNKMLYGILERVRKA